MAKIDLWRVNFTERRTWWWIYEPAWGTICLLKYVTREFFLSFRENLKIYLKYRAQAGSLKFYLQYTRRVKCGTFQTKESEILI